MVYLALYKGKGTAMNALVRFFTKSEYSHCEIAIRKTMMDDWGRLTRVYDCYSSSQRDGGVRRKIMELDDDKWELIPVMLTPEWVRGFFQRTQGKKYDLTGVIGTVLGIPHSKSRYFCSEWAAECLGLKNPERYTPETLAETVKTLSTQNTNSI